MTDTGQHNDQSGELPGLAPTAIATIRDLIGRAEPVTASGEVDPFEVELARFAQNDYGNGQRLRKRHGRDLMYVRDAGWHAWINTHWSQTEGERMALIFAQETAREIMTEALAWRDELLATDEYVRDEKTGVDKRISRLMAWAIKSGDIGKSRAMLDAAEPYLTVSVESLDADPYKFNVLNGTLHLKAQGPDGTFVVKKKHSRKDRITKISRVEYDEEAARPVFDGFLAAVQPQAEISSFLQTWYGYCLTGVTVEQKLMMALGVGANGKSTLEGAMADTFGDYALSLPIASLMSDDRGGRRGSEASPDLARLPGARLVTASEPERGAKFSEGLIKQMTGADMMTVRHLNKGFFDFKPSHKLNIAMNTKPQVRGQDEGIWRRILLVPFDVQIPPEDRDPDLPEKLRAERAGILNWLIDGFRVWNETRLVVPDAVRAATDDYRSESDKVGQFLGAAVVRLKGANVTAKRLYGAFQAWCKLNAEDPISNTAFGRAMTERGYHKEKVGIVYYADLNLIDDFSGQSEIDNTPLNEDAR